MSAAILSPKPSLGEDGVREFAAHDDPGVGVFPDVSADANGRFRIERLVPGQSYNATLYVGIGRPGGPAFVDLKLAPGEVRDLGDLRTRTSSDPDRKARKDAVSPTSAPR